MILLKAPSVSLTININGNGGVVLHLDSIDGERQGYNLYHPHIKARFKDNQWLIFEYEHGNVVFIETLWMGPLHGKSIDIDYYKYAFAGILKKIAERISESNVDLKLAWGLFKFVNELEYRIGREEEEEAKLNDDRIYNLIEQADKCRKEVVLCLLGKPGIGKTEAVERFARDHGRNVVHIIASQILPSEVSGMTMPNQETKSMDIFDHYRLSHMRDGDILFFDELLKGQQQVLNACLTLIQERRLMSGTKLPDVLIIAAANPLPNPMQLPLEIRQRFMFVNVTWDKGSWCDYMEGLGFDNRDSVDALSFMIASKMEEGTNWNTLTPRTATKLCLWLRDSDCSLAVRDYIKAEFGADVLKAIRDAACGKQVDSAEKQMADTVISVLTPIWHDRDYAEKDELYEVIEKARKISSQGDTDVSELASMLEKLPEWEEIKKVLSETEIKKDEIEF